MSGGAHQEQRDLRDLTRYRARLSDDCGRVAARVEKVLEDANIKLAAVASDVLGASGRAMLRDDRGRAGCGAPGGPGQTAAATEVAATADGAGHSVALQTATA